MRILQDIIHKNLKKTKDSLRIFHGRGSLLLGFEHVAIDYFSPNILITLYKDSSDEFINELVRTLKEIPELFFSNILLQKRFLSRPAMDVLYGELPIRAEATEGDAKYILRFSDTQNIGFFLDMKPGRELLERISENKKVLNLFSYTCSLSVAALKGKAEQVVNIDMSKAALSVGEINHKINNIDLRKVRFLSYDIMKSWNNICKHGPYDIVVIDPPTNQGESFKVERDYYKIIKRLPLMVKKEAVVMACLNSPLLGSQYIIDLFSTHAPQFKFQEVIYSAFQDMEVNPEEGLKIVVFKN